MEKRRSIGVTVFSYLGFFSGLSFIALNPLKTNLYAISFSLVIIILSYNLLKLKNFSRIALLIINMITALLILLGAIVIIVWFPLMNAKTTNSSFITSLKTIYPLSKQMQVWKSACPYFPILVPVGLLIETIYIYGSLIFFTRPKVKEQFK